MKVAGVDHLAVFGLLVYLAEYLDYSNFKLTNQVAGSIFQAPG